MDEGLKLVFSLTQRRKGAEVLQERGLRDIAVDAVA